MRRRWILGLVIAEILLLIGFGIWAESWEASAGLAFILGPIPLQVWLLWWMFDDAKHRGIEHPSNLMVLQLIFPGTILFYIAFRPADKNQQRLSDRPTGPLALLPVSSPSTEKIPDSEYENRARLAALPRVHGEAPPEEPAKVPPTQEAPTSTQSASVRDLPRWKVRVDRRSAAAIAIAAIVVVIGSAGLWATKWQYYGQRVGRNYVPASVRVNRWTGARQVFRCSLTPDGAAKVRALRSNLVKAMLSSGSDVGQAPSLTSRPVPSFQRSQADSYAIIFRLDFERKVAEFWPCAACPIDYEKAERIARNAQDRREPPFGVDAQVLRLLESIDAAKAANWKCGWR